MKFRGLTAISLIAMLSLAACSGEETTDDADQAEPAALAEPAATTETPEPAAAAAPAVETEPAATPPEVAPAAEAAPAEDGATPLAEATPAGDETPAEEAAPAAEETPPAEPTDTAAADDGTITGTATAVEAAIIEVDGTRIMLYGLETVYPPQSCTIDGQIWECWAAAFRQLQTYLDEGPVTCTPVAAPDVMRRVLALCEQNGESLNARYVRSGFALAIESEMPEYAALEQAAREEGIGLWQGTFTEPADFRRSRGIFVLRP